MEESAFFIIFVLVIIYFIPAVIAFLKGHLSAGAIFALNLLLGWSLIGWVIALVWSLKNDPDKTTKNIADALISTTDNEIPSHKNQKNKSPSDEISKLADLKDQGLLSEDEFINAKDRIIKNI